MLGQVGVFGFSSVEILEWFWHCALDHYHVRIRLFCRAAVRWYLCIFTGILCHLTDLWVTCLLPLSLMCHKPQHGLCSTVKTTKGFHLIIFGGSLLCVGGGVFDTFCCYLLFVDISGGWHLGFYKNLNFRWSVPIYLYSLSQQDLVHGVTVGGCPLWLWLVEVQYIAHLLMASDGWFLLTNLPVSIFVFVKFHNQIFSVALELVFRLQLWCIRVDSDPS